jgi:hypothetical protein
MRHATLANKARLHHISPCCKQCGNNQTDVKCCMYPGVMSYCTYGFQHLEDDQTTTIYSSTRTYRLISASLWGGSCEMSVIMLNSGSSACTAISLSSCTHTRTATHYTAALQHRLWVIAQNGPSMVQEWSQEVAIYCRRPNNYLERAELKY